MVWSYDLFRIFRKVVKHHTIAVSVEDLFYWFAAALVIFSMIFEKNKGAIRGYAFAGILIGVWIECFAESLFQKLWIKLLKKVGKRSKMKHKKKKRASSDGGKVYGKEKAAEREQSP